MGSPASSLDPVLNMEEYDILPVATLFSPSTKAKSDKAFTPFPLLPTEIQLKIWKAAVPNPRTLYSALTFITSCADSKLDLAHPRAILPQFKELESVSDEARRPTFDEGDEQYDCPVRERVMGGIIDDRLEVMSLLHTCRNSRTATLMIFRLAIDSLIPAENAPLFESTDIVYFMPVRAHHWKDTVPQCCCIDLDPYLESPFFDHWHESRLTQMLDLWLLNRRQTTLQCLSSIQQMAFLVTYEWLWHYADPSSSMERGWFKNFPMLQKIHLFIDPCCGSYFDDGSLQLAKPKADCDVRWEMSIDTGYVSGNWETALRQFNSFLNRQREPSDNQQGPETSFSTLTRIPPKKAKDNCESKEDEMED